MQTGLDGKIVLITGGAQGIGRATALGFAREGARLCLIDIDINGLNEAQSELRALGANVTIAQADLSTAEGVKSGVDAALKSYNGQLDVLVNNVGAGKVRTFDELSDEDWDFTINLNFMSYVRTCRYLLPVLRNREKAAYFGERDHRFRFNVISESGGR
jgi:3-oxoacyl-[acyl-carrier protein] reductase